MEKQTQNAIKLIYKFNAECKDANGASLIDKGYDDLKESAFSIEEMLEGFNTDVLHTLLAMDGEPNTPKDISRKIMWHTNGIHNMNNVDRLDKHLDAIVYNFGSLFKLGLSPQQAIKALTIVAEANMQKLTAGQDEHGKQKKPDGFIPPEERLQHILDEIASAKEQ